MGEGGGLMEGSGSGPTSCVQNLNQSCFETEGGEVLGFCYDSDRQVGSRKCKRKISTRFNRFIRTAFSTLRAPASGHTSLELPHPLDHVGVDFG